MNRTEKSYYHAVDHRYPLCALTLPEIFERAAKRDDGKGLIWHRPAEHWTHKQLYNRAMLYAKGLMAIGLKRGDNMISFGSQGSDSLAMFVACASLGIVFSAPYLYNPVDKMVEQCIRRIKPKFVLVGNALSGMHMVDVFDVTCHILCDNANKPSEYAVPHVYHDSQTCISERGYQNVYTISKSLASLIEAGKKVNDKTLIDAKSLVSVNEPTMYSMSSGTTGEPKLVLIGAAMFANMGIRKQQLGLPFDTRYGVSNMCVEEIALMEEAAGSFYLGYDLVVFPALTSLDEDLVVPEILQCLQDHKPTMVYIDQWYTTYIINHEECTKGYDLSSFKGWIIGGSHSSEQFKKDACRRWPLTTDAYGLTEMYNCLTILPGELSKKPNTVGRLYANMEMKVVDEKGRLVPRNTAGELMLSSYACFLEYKDQPEQTSAVKAADGWLKTGDCAIMDENNEIRIVGRMSKYERFKVNSDVVYSAPIENVMKKNKKIKEISVVAVNIKGGSSGDELVYCIVLNNREMMSEAEVAEFAEDNLTENELPMRVFFYKKFPRHGSRAKISRQMLINESQKRILLNSSSGLVKQLLYTTN